MSQSKPLSGLRLIYLIRRTEVDVLDKIVSVYLFTLEFAKSWQFLWTNKVSAKSNT